MVRSGPRAVSVTLSGISPESRSRVNTFAYNQILGGRLGVHNAQDLAIVGNYIEIGPGVRGNRRSPGRCHRTVALCRQQRGPSEERGPWAR